MIVSKLIRHSKTHFGFSSDKRKILLTGIQPTGNLHVGNYLGSITNMLKYQ